MAIAAALRQQGLVVNHKKLRHLMREHRLRQKGRRRFIATTDSNHGDPIFPNLAKDIVRTGPNQLWIGDITYSWFSQHRDLPVAKRFLRRALQRHCRPDRIVIDGSQTNREAIRVRKSQYLNNWIEQDHRRTKRRVRPMLGFKAFTAAAVTLAGIDMVHMMRKRQGRFAFNPLPTLKEQSEAIAN